VATGTGVIVVQAADEVKPEQATEVGPLPIDRTAQFLAKLGLDSSCEAGRGEDLSQPAIQPTIGGVSTLDLRSSLTPCPRHLPQRNTADDCNQ
jgi:hypothetical protein